MSLPFVVVVDSREKRPYDFGSDVQTIRRKLDTGDYSIDGYEDMFSVERKSLPDLLKSITWDRDRFKKEIRRGNELGRFTVVIESSKQDVLNWNYQRDVHPNSVMGTVREWEKWNNVNFRWAGDRNRAKNLTLKLLTDWWTENAADEIF